MAEIVAQFREYARLERKRTGEGLTPSELRRWTRLKRSLSLRFNPQLSDDLADRRGSIRVPTRLSVSFSSLGELRQCLMLNLSRRGLFVASEELAPIGTRFDLRLHIEQSGTEIHVPCEVVSHGVGPRYRSQVSGMGMRFLDMTPETEKLIDDLYEHSLMKAAEG